MYFIFQRHECSFIVTIMGDNCQYCAKISSDRRMTHFFILSPHLYWPFLPRDLWQIGEREKGGREGERGERLGEATVRGGRGRGTIGIRLT